MGFRIWQSSPNVSFSGSIWFLINIKVQFGKLESLKWIKIFLIYLLNFQLPTKPNILAIFFNSLYETTVHLYISNLKSSMDTIPYLIDKSIPRNDDNSLIFLLQLCILHQILGMTGEFGGHQFVVDIGFFQKWSQTRLEQMHWMTCSRFRVEEN